MTRETIGFVGVGLMGHGMAKNLLAAGFPLTVIAHKNRAPIEDLLGRGAKEAAWMIRTPDPIIVHDSFYVLYGSQSFHKPPMVGNRKCNRLVYRFLSHRAC